ncbi:MAG: hypothetical protein ABI091_20510 [Ferruginibacter sp.]
MGFKLALIILPICFLISCSQLSSRNISVVPLKMLNYLDTISNDGKALTIFKTEFYLIKAYSASKKTDQYIDSFIMKNKDTYLGKYSSYKMVFYKESSETNLENIASHPKIIDRYSQEHDLVYDYTWSNGKFVYRYKFKNGEIIDPKNHVIVKDVDGK